MTRLLVAGKLHAAGEALIGELRAGGMAVDYVEEVSEPAYAPLISEADALVIRTQPLGAATLARARRLKVVSRHGVGYDAIDLAALNARGIALAIVGDVNSVSVAEHAMLQLLAASRQLLRADRAVRAPGGWGWRNRLEAHEISGRNLLIVGYGRAGRHLARMAAGFDMQIRAHDPLLARAGWPAGPVAPVADLHEGLAWADCVSLHVPAGPRPVLGPAEIAAMKPGAVLANSARGGVVDEAALRAALASGRIAAAGIDVFAAEPPPADPFPCDNAILSPHIAGLTEEAARRMAVGAIRNALAFLDGRLDPALIVNPEHCHG